MATVNVHIQPKSSKSVVSRVKGHGKHKVYRGSKISKKFSDEKITVLRSSLFFEEDKPIQYRNPHREIAIERAVREYRELLNDIKAEFPETKEDEKMDLRTNLARVERDDPGLARNIRELLAV